MSRWAKVAVLGTGLLGGSVAAAVRARGLARTVWGYDPKNALAAQALGWIDQVAESLCEAVRDAECVVLAAPVAVNVAWLQEGALLEALSDQALITDVSSTKATVVAAARVGLGGRLAQFVAAHPLTGSERSGPSAAHPDLFQGAWILTCPLPENPPAVVESVARFWHALGGRVASMAPSEHDRLCAEVSHWPHAVAFALAAAIGSSPVADLAQSIHGPGLRDTTRIAAASPELWAGILLDNRAATLQAAVAYRSVLDAMEQALRENDREALTQALARGAQWRRGLESEGARPPTC